MKKFICNFDVDLMMPVVMLVLLMGFTAYTTAAQTGNNHINRYVMAISANNGGDNRPMLRYAESDAKSFANVLKEMGGVQAQNVVLVKQPSVASLKQEMSEFDKKISKAGSAGGRNEVLVYYSGHADERGLRLGNETYAWKEFRDRVDSLNADVKIAVIDACGSGAITRAKGGVAVPAFMVDESSDMKGYAFITSSTQDEASQESDRLKGSFFTHSLVSGLRGAGDVSGDGRVTLSEAYQFAFNETLQKTETTMGGAQHPSRDMNLAGTGDVVMTDLHSTNALLDLASDVDGRLFIRNENGELVAELNKKGGHPISLGLPAGKYGVRLEVSSKVKEVKVSLTNGKPESVALADFRNVEVEKTVLRGEISGKRVCSPEDTAQCSLDSLEHNGSFHTSFNFLDRDNEPRKGLMFGLAGTKSRDYMLGLEVGLFFNIAKKEMHGMQVSLLANIEKERFEGVQLNTGLNYARFMDGLQLSSTLNVARAFKGAQIASFMNVSVDASRGVQIASMNVAGDTVLGAQVGVLNYAKQTSIQVAVTNVAKYADVQVSTMNFAKEVNMAQIGTINYATNAKGRQWGIINIAPHAEKTPVGLINIVGNGVWSLTGTYNEMGGTGAKLDLGTAYFYTSFEVARNFKDGEQFKHYEDEFQNGIGIGTHLGKYGSHFDLEYMFFNISGNRAGVFEADADDSSIDFTFAHINNSAFLHRLRAGATYQLFNGVGLVGGVSLNMYFRGNTGKLFLEPMGEYHADIKPERDFGRFWPGFYAGFVVGRF